MPKIPKQALDSAKALLEKIHTPEIAAKLAPEERQAYLNALDLVHGPREVRAKNMGFGDDTWYHGTTAEKPIEAFNSKNSATGQLFGRGNYITKDPHEAGIYTEKLDPHSGHALEDESGSIYPLRTRANKPFGGEAEAPPEFKVGLEKLIGKENLPSNWGKINKENRLLDASMGKVDPTALSKLVVDHGYDSILAGKGLSSTNERILPNMNVINSKNLRSTNAAFDPRFKDSNHLLAGAGMAMPAAQDAQHAGMDFDSLPHDGQEQFHIPAQDWQQSVIAQPDQSWGAADYFNAALGYNKNLPQDINEENARQKAEDMATGFSGTIGKAVPKIGTVKGKPVSEVLDLLMSQGATKEQAMQSIRQQTQREVGTVKLTGDPSVPSDLRKMNLQQAINRGKTDVTGYAEGGDIEAPHAGMDFDSLEDDSDVYGTPGQMALTALEGAGQGFAGPLFPMVEKAVGVNPEDILARQRENPIVHGAGEIVSLGAGLMTGTGEAAVMTKAGKLAQETMGLTDAARLSHRVGSEAVKQAAEMAVLESGNEASKMVLNDPDATAETAVANVGLAAALGAGGGALWAGAVNPLWSATAGPKVDKFLSGMSDYLNGGGKLALPEEIEAAQKTLGVELNPFMRSGISGDPKAAQLFNELREAQHPEILKGIKDMQKSVNETLTKGLGVVPEDIANYSENAAGHDLLKTLRKEYTEKFAPVQAQYDALKLDNAAVALPDEEKLQEFSKLLEKGQNFGAGGSPYAKLFDDYGQRVLQQDTLGKMDNLITEINGELKKAYTGGDTNTASALREIKDTMQTFQERMILKSARGVEKEGVQDALRMGEDLVNARVKVTADYKRVARISDRLSDEMGLGDFKGAKHFLTRLADKKTPEQVLKALSPRGNADLIPFLQEHFPETLAKLQENELKQLLRPAILGAKGDDLINVKTLGNAVDKLLAGQPEYAQLLMRPEQLQQIKAAQTLLSSLPEFKSSGTAGWMSKLTAHIPQSALAAVSLLTGHNPVAGYLIGHAGKLLAKEVPEAVKLGMLKFLSSDQPIKAEGFKAMVDYMNNTIKGESMLAKATKGVFKAGAQVMAEHAIPTDKDRTKLNKIVDRATNEPLKFMQGVEDTHLGHYLPNHQAALAQVSSRTISYLQSVKPKATQVGPLDKPLEPSQAQMQRYNRALDIAQQPLVVMEHIKKGTLQASDIADLKGMYPALYNQMASRVMNEIVGKQAKEEQIPYHTRMSLSLFLGQPLDATMQPMSIVAAQPKGNQQQQPQSGMPMPNRKGTSSLGKSAETYRTPEQTSAVRRARID